MNAMPVAKLYVKPANYKVSMKHKSPSPTSTTSASGAHHGVHHGNHEHNGTGATLKHVNEVQVVGTGEVFLAPDRCRLCVSVTSEKADIYDVKTSVTRRLDYIVQVMHNHGVKKDDIEVSKVLQQIGGMFHYDAQIVSLFTNFYKCQDVCNLLVEKLDQNVRISPPEFFSTPHKMETVRRQASLVAVKNAKLKAVEMAHYLKITLGDPILVREVSCDDDSNVLRDVLDTDGPSTVQQYAAQATVHVIVKVLTVFAINKNPSTGSKKKNQ